MILLNQYLGIKLNRISTKEMETQHHQWVNYDNKAFTNGKMFKTKMVI